MLLPQIPLKNINNLLSGLGNRLNFKQISEKSVETKQNYEALNKSTLSKEVGAKAAGFESITQEVDDLIDESTGVINAGVAILTENPPGITLTSPLDGAAQTGLNTITGTSGDMTEAITDTVITLPTAEALSTTLQSVGNLNSDETRTAIGDVVPTGVNLPNVLDVSSVFLGFSNTIDQVNNSFNVFVGRGFGQVIKDLVEGSSQPLNTVIETLADNAPSGVPNSKKREIIAFIDDGDYLSAASILEPYSTKSKVELESELSTIDTRLDTLIYPYDPAYDDLGTSTAETFPLGKYDADWNGSSTAVKGRNYE